MLEISNRYITSPATAKADGLGLEDGQEFWIHDCYIDLQDKAYSPHERYCMS